MSGLERIRFCQKILDQAGKARRVFDLRPVAAFAEHVQLAVQNPLVQGQ